jgi:hypothetical protein
MIQHTAFFGDGEKTFAFPTRELIEELERKTGHAIGTLFNRFQRHDFSFSDLTEIIRLGLIGGGTTPAEADRLVSVYSINRPLTESFFVALGIVNALFFGKAEPAGDAQDEIRQAAASGDMSTASNEALEQVTA